LISFVSVVGFFSLGLSVFAQESFRWELVDQQRLPAPEVLSMVADDLGTKWIATHGGLSSVSRFDDYKKYNKANTQSGLPNDTVHALAIGDNRDLWVGTEKGLSKWNGAFFTALTFENSRGGIPDNGITSLAVGRKEVWVGTRNGFAQWRGGTWTTYTGDRISGRLPHRGVTAIALDSAGNTWVGTIAGLVRFRGASWTLYTKENTQGGLPHSSITYLTVSPGGDLWVGTQAGPARLAKNQWQAFTAPEVMQEIAGELVYSIVCDANGKVWVASKGGAAGFDGKSWTLFTKNTTTGIRTRWVYCVLPLEGGETWFGTQKGISRRIPVPNEE